MSGTTQSWSPPPPSLWYRALMIAAVLWTAVSPDGAWAASGTFLGFIYSLPERASMHACGDAAGNVVVALIDHYPCAPGYYLNIYHEMPYRRSSSGAAVTEGTVENIWPYGTIGLACADDGHFVVAWERNADPGEGRTIRARRYDENAVADADEVVVASSDELVEATRPVVCVQPDSSFVVVWQSQLTSDTDRSVIRGRRYDSDGLPAGEPFTIAPDSASVASPPTICCAGDSGFVVMWVKDVDVQEPGNDGLAGRRFSATGEPLGTELHVSVSEVAGATSLWSPSLACFDDGGFVVVWAGGSAPSAGKVFSNTGEAVAPAFRVAPPESWRPTVATLGDGGFVVAWAEGELREGTIIRAQQFDRHGFSLGTEAVVDDGSGFMDYDPTVVSGAPGEFVVAWTTDVYFAGHCEHRGYPEDPCACPSGSAELWLTPAAVPDEPSCGDPASGEAPVDVSGVQTDGITASDALAVLQAAVGLRDCPNCICDVDGSGTVAAIDALRVLRYGLGDGTTLSCPPCV